MKIFLQTLAVGISMFSAIPMPQFEWNDRNMRGSLISFVLVGVVIGLIVWAWTAFSLWLGVNSALYAAGLTFFPLLVSGGIHMDGFCDTTDALASHASRDRKLEIMSDSHTGAFAVIAVGAYLVLYFGFATELPLSMQTAFVLASVYVMTRAASGFAVAAFKPAKGSGLVHTFADMAAKRLVRIGDGAIFIVAAAAVIIFSGTVGIGAVAGVVLMFAWYRVMSAHVFGGITGDLAGWFLQNAELFGVAGAVIALLV